MIFKRQRELYQLAIEMHSTQKSRVEKEKIYLSLNPTEKDYLIKSMWRQTILYKHYNKIINQSLDNRDIKTKANGLKKSQKINQRKRIKPAKNHQPVKG